MRKKGLRCVIAVMVAVVVGICSAGCAGKEKTFPTYGTDKSFYIAGWGSPYAAEEDYRLAKEAGINHFLVVEAYSPSGTFIPTDLLELNKGAGITTVMHTNNDYGKAVDGKLSLHDTDYKDFSEYIDRICYCDEPVYSNFSTLKEWAKAHDEKYGDEFTFYVNLMGSYMRTEEMGDTAETQNYDHFVDEFCSQVLSEIKTGKRVLSCDMYPFSRRNGRVSILTGWLYTLEKLMYSAKENGAVHEEFIQVTEHLTNPKATEESIRYQAYVLLNFEVSGLTYFTYSSPFEDYKNSCVNLNKSQSLNDEYYYVKTVNSELRAFENIYLNYSVDGVMPVYGTENDYDVDENGEVIGNPLMRMMRRSLKSVDKVKSITATEDTLVSDMTDKDGNKAYLITNFSNPYDGNSDVVDITFDKKAKYTRLAVFRKGERKVYEVKDNKFTLELESGEGVFVMPA